MLTYLSNLMLGAAGRASKMVLDAEARIVMPDHWRLDWRAWRDGHPAAWGAGRWTLG